MGKTNSAVNEENRKTGQRQEPVENGTTVVGQVDECETTKEKLKNNDIERTTLLVNVSQELRSHAWINVSFVSK